MYWKIVVDKISNGKNNGTWGEAGYGCCVYRDGKPTTRTHKNDIVCPASPEDLCVAFQIRDDDGEAYYEGRMTHALALSDGVLSPLDDFATPSAGATSLEISFDGVEWEQV